MAESASTAQKRAELRKATIDLTERGLHTAARWAAEQLAGCLHTCRSNIVDGKFLMMTL